MNTNYHKVEMFIRITKDSKDRERLLLIAKDAKGRKWAFAYNKFNSEMNQNYLADLVVADLEE